MVTKAEYRRARRKMLVQWTKTDDAWIAFYFISLAVLMILAVVGFGTGHDGVASALFGAVIAVIALPILVVVVDATMTGTRKAHGKWRAGVMRRIEEEDN